MLRKALAVLLVFSWVVLSGVDLLEDFDLPVQVGVHSPLEEPLSNGGPSVNVVNNILESADSTRQSYVGLFEIPIAYVSIETDLAYKKASKIHELHRVFLI